jgi:uncharacterized protein (TIGR03435 family)
MRGESRDLQVAEKKQAGREIGLKFEKVQRPEPVLVIDHVDEQPTPN